MAKTSKGIYYPYNYNEIADVPEDMKQMAESINKILEDKEADETTQDAKITILQNKVADLEQENTDLASNMPWNTVSGESLHIEDSAKYSKNRLSISGNLKETLADSTQEKSTTNPATIAVATGVQKIRQFRNNYFDVNDKIEGKNHTVEEGDWVTLEKNNTSTSTAFVQVYTKKSSRLKTNTLYSIVAEIKKISGEGEIRFVSDITSNFTSQFSQDATYNLSDLKAGDIIILKRTSKADFTNCVTMLRTYLAVSAGKSGSITLRISVLEDTSITTDNFKYEPYAENIETVDLGSTELCKITDANGNVVAQDRAVFRNNKWQWEKNVKKIVLNGTENWGKSSNTANISYFLNSAEINAIDINTITSESNRSFVAKAVCNYLPVVSLNTLFSNAEGFALDKLNSGTIELRLGFGLDTEITTVALLKQWLAQKYAEGNPVTIYFVLATPVYTDCIEEQSTVLDKLYNNFKLAKGVNNVIVESDNGAGVEMELDYMQDNILKDKKLEERITALENLLSTTQTSALLLDNLQNDLESEVN